MKQHYEQYTAEHQEVWQRLFSRQKANLIDKASGVYNHALQGMNHVLQETAIPHLDELSNTLYRHNGWTITVVPGLIPVNDFFTLLAERKFCSSTWLRQLSQLDYLEEPDMFHDVFGHVPLLLDHAYAGFMQQVGMLGVKYAAFPEVVAMLERFYWFTIEFGLVGNTSRPEIYGAGIISSFGETNSIFSGSVAIRDFDLEDILYHPFTKETLQHLYYCVPSLEKLYQSLPDADQLLQAAVAKTVAIEL